MAQKGKDYGAYYHERFLRGRPDLCSTMQRLTPVDGARRIPQNEPNFYSLEPAVQPSQGGTPRASESSATHLVSTSPQPQSMQTISERNFNSGAMYASVSTLTETYAAHVQPITSNQPATRTSTQQATPMEPINPCSQACNNFSQTPQSRSACPTVGSLLNCHNQSAQATQAATITFDPRVLIYLSILLQNALYATQLQNLAHFADPSQPTLQQQLPSTALSMQPLREQPETIRKHSTTAGRPSGDEPADFSSFAQQQQQQADSSNSRLEPNDEQPVAPRDIGRALAQFLDDVGFDSADEDATKKTTAL
jgi:hypothetical protein